MNNYIVYHLHSDLSNAFTTMDSVTKFKDYVEYAQSLNMKSLAFSEHGNILNWVQKKQYIEKSGMKYIHAIEAYVTFDLNDIKRDNYHIILIAKNLDGVREINKLCSFENAFNRNSQQYYYAPRILYNSLKKTSKNIIITTACIGGILNNGTEELQNDFINFLSINNDRCFLEIQHHNVKDQIDYNKKMHEISKRYNIKLITGTDTHCLNDKHIKGRELLQKRKGIHFNNENAWDLTFKTFDELIESYKVQDCLKEDVYIEAIENTNLMSDMVEEFNLDYSHKYPKLYDNSELVFKDKINKGYIKRGIDKLLNKQEYLDRIKYESNIIMNNGSIDYFLLEENIKTAMANRGIYPGYSRGSVSGSIIAYLLGITEIDSIKFNMNFERFMNNERVSLADIDTDWSPKDRDTVKEYIYSLPNIYASEIITFNTIALKGAIRDCGAGLDMPLDLVDYIAKNVEDKEEEFRSQYDELFKFVDMLQGVIVSIGNHPAATIVSPYNLDELLGTCSTKKCKYPVSQVNMKEVDSLNYVKLDILGLDNVGIINETCKLAKIDRLTPDNIDFLDDNVWNNLIKSPVGIFQFEKDYSHKYLSDLLNQYDKIKKDAPDINKIDIMSLANGAIRPAGESYRADMALGNIKKYNNTGLDGMMSLTMGQMIYQETIIKFLNEFCGYTLGEADIVRRCFSKKLGTEEHIPKIKSGFISTMIDKYNISRLKAEDDVESFLKVIEDASNYLFSKNHSDPYSFIGFATAYLRTYHPLEFLSVVLNYNESNLDKTAKIVDYAENIAHIKIESIKFKKSDVSYTPNKDDNNIYKGLHSVKGIGIDVAKKLYDLRFNIYDDFLSSISDIIDCGVQKDSMETLIKLGYFSNFGKSKTSMNQFKIYREFNNRKVIKKGKYKKAIENIISKYSYETEKQYRSVDISKVISSLFEKIKDEEFSISQRIMDEIEYMGYSNIKIPTLKKNCIVLEKDIKYSPKITLMSLNNGKTAVVKCTKTIARDLKKGDLIRADKMDTEAGWSKDSNGKWIKDPSKIVWRLHKFIKITEDLL